MERTASELAARGRAFVTVVVEVDDEARVTVLTADVEWFVTKAQIAQS